MSYSAEEKKDILQKVIKITLRVTRNKPGYAPDFFIAATVRQALDFIEKYQDQSDIDIWRQARLDYYTKHLIQKLIIEYGYDYELSDENFEAVSALIEAESMLGEKSNDADLCDLFDYTEDELERLRIIAKYLNGIDTDDTFNKLSKKYLSDVV